MTPEERLLITEALRTYASDLRNLAAIPSFYMVCGSERLRLRTKAERCDDLAARYAREILAEAEAAKKLEGV